MRNLVTVCSSCHDAHHAGTLDIKPLVQTSEGAKRINSDGKGSIKTVRRTKWTDEQVQQIQEYLKGHPSVLPKRAVFDLGELGIKITVAGLRSFMQKV